MDARKITLMGLLMALSPCLHGVIITSAVGNSGDTYINEGKSGFNYGSVDYLNVGTADNNKIRNAYVSFDLDTLGFDPSDAGFLEFTITAAIDEDVRANDVIGIFGIPDGAPGDGNGTDGITSWDESTITYDNAPLIINGTNNGAPLATAQIPAANFFRNKNDPGRFQFSAGYTFTFQSADLLNFLKADTNGIVTFVLQYASGGLDFMFPMAFSENANAAYRPSIEVTAVPEPKAFALIALVGGIVFFQRRASVANAEKKK